MKLLVATDQSQWDAFQTAQPWSQFTQSWAWGEYRIATGSPVRRYFLSDDSGVVASIQLEYRQRRFGVGYWFAAHGPVFRASLSAEAKRDAMREFCELLLQETELRKKTLFWRIEPMSEITKPEGLVPLSFRRVPSADPASTILLDLAPSQEELLAKMHEKTRYNIRLAERHGVRVRIAQTLSDVEAFLDLMDETAYRDGFTQLPRTYLKATYDAMSESRFARIRLAELDGKVLSANLEMAYGDTVTYLYGASSSENRNVMAPFALHWNAIREAKALGHTLYDFWGVNPENKGNFYYKASWEGISRFKRGWGGRQADLVGTWDLPFNIYLYRAIFFRQFFRG